MSDLAHVLPWAQDEAELVTELQGGSDAAFDWLVTHYTAPVYSLVAGMLSEACDAADVTQEVFLKAFRGIRGFRRGSSLKTWLYRIAVREALNHRRWFWRHHRYQTSLDAEPLRDDQAPLQIEDEGATPFDRLASREAQQAVQSALRQVPPAFRTAVILRDLEGLSYDEVAEVLDVSVGTVKSRILRGRRLLREILAPLLRPLREAKPLCHATSTLEPGVSHRRETMSRLPIVVLHSPMFSASAGTDAGAQREASGTGSGKQGRMGGGVR